MPQGVVEQDTHDLDHPFTVADGLHLLVWQPQIEVRLVLHERRPELVRHADRELAEVHLLGLHLERACVQARQVEQVDGELLQPLHLLAHRVEELLAGGGLETLVLEQLDEAREREDRGSQLVGRVGDELLARPVDASELHLHLVEGLRQAAELVRAVYWQRGGGAPGRQVPRGGLEALHPAGQGPGHEEARDQCDQKRGAARLEQPVAHERDDLVGVGEGARVDRDPGGAAAVEERFRHLAGLVAARGGGSARASQRECPRRQRGVQRDAAFGVRVGDHVELGVRAG